MFNNLSVSLSVGTIPALLLCTVVSLALGVGVALIYRFRSEGSPGFVLTLALLPAMVQMVIMLVNGNIGTGVAVAGAFSLVRFRSAPGSAREIAAIFFAMAVGLATGTGYLLAAAVFFAVIAACWLLLTALRFGQSRTVEKELRITIPEELEYDGLFQDIFDQYLSGCQLNRVKTVNMGSMFQLRYLVTLKQAGSERALIDALRARNGNLPISFGLPQSGRQELQL